MESPADYLDSPMDGDDVAYPCKGCGDILEEGKAFELAGNRWHLNCFRCNTCGTLLDSDANLLLLGDGSLICNNCTYSCSACGNKIEDLAILTGDQAFCATCFRCRNCKRKIENLRYARTSQGIFCMSCHESLMARRRKKSRAAANAKMKKDDQSPMLVDKSLPALPPNADLRSAFSPDRDAGESVDNDTPTELSPRPRQTYQDSSSRSSSQRPREGSGERTSSEGTTRDGLTLPTSTYRNNRHSAISQASDVGGGDGESFFIPLALDTSAAPAATPRSIPESVSDRRKTKENKPLAEKDYFNINKSNGRSSNDSRRGSEMYSNTSTPHIAFQEKGRQASTDETAQIKDNIRKAQAGGRGSSKTSSPAVGNDEVRTQIASSPKVSSSKGPSSSDKFRLGEVPKGRKASTPRSGSNSEIENGSRSTPSSGLSSMPPRKGSSTSIPKTDSPQPLLGADRSGTPRSSQESRSRDEPVSRPSIDSNGSSPHVSRMDSGGSRTIQRKEIAPGPATTKTTKTTMSSMSSSSGAETSPSTESSSGTPGLTPKTNGKTISGPTLIQSPMEEDLAPPSRAPTRPAAPQTKMTDTYMAPRAPPAPPATVPHSTKDPNNPNGQPSPLPRWSAGGDFTMDEDMARILGGTDESSQSILRRVSNAVRHGRNGSEASASARHGHGRSVSETTTRTLASPRWPKTPILEDGTTAKDISSPISIVGSPMSGEDPALLRRQLRNSEQRVAELERQFTSEKDLKTLNKKLLEKRKTVSVLDSQTEIMIKQLEVLAGYVERAKDSKQPINIAELEDSSVKEFVQKLDRLKQTMSGAVEALYEERNDLLEEKNQIIADRDRALVEFEQLSSKNAQLADMNNDLTHQIQERFKSQSSGHVESPRPPMNGLGIYTHHTKDKSSVSVAAMDDSSLRPTTSSTTVFGSVNSYPQTMEQDPSMEPATVLSAPHVINIRKGQAKKFNWKKGGQTVAKGVSKGFKGAFSSVQQERNPQWQGQTGESIGMPYNMTVAPVESAAAAGSNTNLPRSVSNDPRQGGGGFGLFKKTNTIPKSMSNGEFPAAAAPSTLFGSDLVERADYERRQIPSVVTRCIEEVELRGMDIEGIYRKTGGSGQVKSIQEGFEKTEDYDISDYGLDITAVTSVLKQYFRKLPTPLLTFEVYDRILESTSVEDEKERCVHLRRTFNMLPPKHRDCLEFLIFHLDRVARRNSENLMTPKNLAVVFAPTIMRDHSLEREMTDMHAKNNAVQFIIENTHEIFANA